MPISYIGPRCARRGCSYPVYGQGLCVRCWRLARMFGRDMAMFAYEPLHAYRDERDAVELPWERWEHEARARGGGVEELFAPGPATEPHSGDDGRER